MSIFDLPEPATCAAHFNAALLDSSRHEDPYRHWKLANVLPEPISVGIAMLPIKPPLIDECGGVRDLDTNNSKRCFLTPQLQADFPVCAALANAMQLPAVARAFAQTLQLDLDGAYLRMEYIQDTDGAWLEPHRDIHEKLFSMVIYLCTGPHAKEWGTDIYDANQHWVGRSAADFNTAVIFVPGPATWHGFDKRPIIGVRRLMEINYVRPTWRDREQLSFPDQAIRLE